MRSGETRCRPSAAILLLTVITVVDAASAGTLNATVQSGTLTSSSSGTVSATISPVDPTRTFLIFQTRHNSDRPTGSMVRGTIGSSTSVDFTRVANDSSTITIQWYVVEYESGVRVQRGSIDQDLTTLNVPITPVASTSQTFLTWSKTPGSTNNVFDDKTPVYVDFPPPPTAGDQLIIRSGEAAPGNTISWQVIEFLDPTTINVQRGLVSLSTAALTVEATLPTPVDVNSSFCLVGYITSGSGGDNIGANLVRAQLLDSDTIRIDRNNPGTALNEIAWQVVELRDGSLVQRGNQNFGVGESLKVVNVSSVDLSRAVPLAASQPFGGQNTGRTTYSTSDIPGVGSVTMAVSGSDLFLTRDNTLASADVGWFLIEWGPSALVPSIFALNPTSGASRGGESVSILGANFTPSTALFFDGTPVSSLDIQSSNSLVAITPPHAPGPVLVTVTTEHGVDSLAGGFTYDPPVPFIRGDANGDGMFNVADAVFVIQYLFNPPAPAPNCFDAGDMNDDGALNISDIVFALSFLFQDGTIPSPPYPGCSLDPTEDTLGCVLHGGC